VRDHSSLREASAADGETQAGESGSLLLGIIETDPIFLAMLQQSLP